MKEFCLSGFTKHSVCSSLGGQVQEVGVMLKANISSITRPYQNPAQAVVSYVLFQKCETLCGQKLEKSSSLQWSFHQIRTLTARISLLWMWSPCRVPVIRLSHMQLCSSIKKKWDFKSKNMGENQDQRCYDGRGLWHFMEVQKLLIPKNTTRKRSSVFFWRILRLQLTLRNWYMRRKKEMS